ncbi:MAG TPA: flippase [bacterium]|nr:flippase [bacterium]
MRRIIRNTIFMSLFGIIARGAGLIRYVFLVTFLSNEAFGILKLATDIGGVARAFMDGGLDQLVSRDGARRPDQLARFFWTACFLKILLAILFFAVAPFLLLRFMTPSSVWVAMIYSGFVVALSLAGIARSAFTALERMEYIFYTNTPSRIIGLGVTFVCLLVGAPLGIVASAMGSENVLWLVLLMVYMVRLVSLARPRIDLREAGWMMSESWPMALYGFFTTLYLRLDTLMLKWLLPQGTALENIGIYGKAQYPVEGLSLLLTGYIIAVFPVFSRLQVEDRQAFASLFRRSTVLLMGITIPVSIMMAGWADGWLSLFPNKAEGSVPILAILAMTLNFSLLNVFIITAFTACDRQRWLVLFTCLTVAVSFISNYVMIPILGNLGAAFASLGSQVFLFAVMLTILWTEVGIAPPVGRWLGLLVSGNLAGLFCDWLLPPGWVLVLPVPYLGSFLLIAFVLRVIRREDIEWLRRTLRRT